MTHKFLWVIGGLLVCMAFSGCSQPPPTQALPTMVPAIVPTSTAPVPSHMIRLPIIKNGSELTPTPFLPHESTPVYLPTQIPEVDQASRAKDLQPVAPLVTAVPRPMPLLGDQAASGDELINFLLVGSDKRSGPYFRTDTLIIASIRPRQQVVSLISIPRDLFVYIPGWTMQRINTAYLRGVMSKYPGGGAELLKDTIRYNLGIRIDKLAIVDFNGFKKIVDVIGGVDLPLVCAYTDWHVINPRANLENPNNWKLYTVGPGIVHMDGDLALWYSRSRLRSNDFDRGRRQQEVLRGIYNKSLQIGVLPRIPELYQQVSDIVTTDIGLNQVLALAPMALSLDAPRIRSYYISSKYVKGWWTPQGASVLLPKREKLEVMLEEAMLPPDDLEEDRLTLEIEIVNNTANPGVDVLAAERLHYAGFETAILPGTGEPAKKSWLYSLTGVADPGQAAYILDVLGLPSDRLSQEVTPKDAASGSQAAYRLIIGKDYNPCFNPSKLKR
jgi:LCP family protein required for cell wall assembly